ncbi:uncharacterized protein LOC130998099 [Salvia miltiorrhiza]|uniref:uncharacterized protein LOC130998099 n=1 Tax=Salvia miltiorrhiza TaxID=226208 RepID=UPI0025AC2740|nr:uncharacterized protein LOC130998099 [Salvia miltiorrhiza]
MSPSRKTLCLLMFISCISIQECKGDDAKGYYNPPVECSRVDCPPFTVIYGEKDFEIRNYSQSLWVTAPGVEQYSLMGGLGKAGNNLIPYYYRQINQGMSFVPYGPLVMMDVINSTYTNYFYVPHKYQNGGLPKPFTPEIKQVKLPKYKYAAVRRIHGEISDENVAAQVDALRKNLKASAYQRAADRPQFTFVLYIWGIFNQGYELLIWFD